MLDTVDDVIVFPADVHAPPAVLSVPAVAHTAVFEVSLMASPPSKAPWELGVHVSVSCVGVAV